MNIALLVMTDGRKEYINSTITSASTMLKGPIGPLFMYDDSGDEHNHLWLKACYPQFELIYKETRQGFGGAIHSAWNHIKQYDFDYVFHLEDDFTFNREIPLEDMIRILEENPDVYQMALKRQPWSSDELRLGGFMNVWPDEYHQHDGWVSHKLFFTSNPNLYRKSLIESRSYPNRVGGAESIFSQEILNTDPNALFGYWGQKNDTPWVHHIGVTRKGNIY